MTEAMKRLERLIDTFSTSLSYYKDAKNNYNEHSCRIEYIDPLLEMVDSNDLAMNSAVELSPCKIHDGYFQVMAEPVSTCVQDNLLSLPRK